MAVLQSAKLSDRCEEASSSARSTCLPSEARGDTGVKPKVANGKLVGSQSFWHVGAFGMLGGGDMEGRVHVVEPQQVPL